MTHATRIGYSTNVHTGRTLDEALVEIDRVAPRVRDRLIQDGVLQRSEPLELGLWLSSRAAQQLREGDGGVESLAERLGSRGLLARSLNGFPFGHFHADRVKHAVYRPSWADAARLLYTQDLAEIAARFARCAGRGEASVSTLPIGWRAEILTSANGAALGVAASHLEQLVRFLATLEERTGVRVHVDLEPEPGCFMDTARDAVNFFEQTLRPRRGDPDARRYLGICHDTCHAAVMWESQSDVLDTYRAAGIRVGRVQLSSALAAHGADQISRLAAFAEARYLHQTTLRGADGGVRFFEDLAEAIDAAAALNDPALHARAHFHVPLAFEHADGIGTTRNEVDAFFDAWPVDEPWPALEVETYTWSVLPAALQPDDLADGIASELRWAHAALNRAEARRVTQTRKGSTT